MLHTSMQKQVTFLPRYRTPQAQTEGTRLLIKIAVMLQNRTYVQEWMAHYHP